MNLSIRIPAFTCVLLCLAASGADKQLAEALCSGVPKLVAEGKLEKAKDLCYKALANDENCPDALFELGKIFEKEGNLTAAGDFLVRAGREYGKGEAEKKEWASKRMECETRAKRLNPYSARFASLLADYTAELNNITKKSTDAMTLDEACDRSEALKLRAMLPPDKGPKFDRPTAVASKTDKKEPEDEVSKFVKKLTKQPTETNVPPDVEKALKAAGWDKILGTWKKIKDNVYEVTDGRLETSKINGALQVTVYKGGTGSVKAVVRNGQDDFLGMGGGFGYQIEGSSAKLYTPNGFGNKYFATMEREDPLGEAPKNVIAVTVEDSKLEYFLNGVRKKTANNPIPKTGPFVIRIEGTMTIESPQAKGQ